jgi:hypothetical protein
MVVQVESKLWIPQDATTPHEIWIPAELRLWRKGRKYIAVIGSERDVEALLPFAGRRVILRIGEIYIDGTLLKVKHGNKFELVIVLPSRMALTWEALRAKGTTRNGIIILKPTNELHGVA